MSKTKSLYGFESVEKAIEAVRAEVSNWGWIDRQTKDKIVEDAQVNESSNRFGPVFSVTFEVV